jgi:hypothetical protein
MRPAPSPASSSTTRTRKTLVVKAFKPPPSCPTCGAHRMLTSAISSSSWAIMRRLRRRRSSPQVCSLNPTGSHRPVALPRCVPAPHTLVCANQAWGQSSATLKIALTKDAYYPLRPNRGLILGLFGVAMKSGRSPWKGRRRQIIEADNQATTAGLDRLRARSRKATERALRAHAMFDSSSDLHREAMLLVRRHGDESQSRVTDDCARGCAQTSQ